MVCCCFSFHSHFVLFFFRFFPVFRLKFLSKSNRQPCILFVHFFALVFSIPSKPIFSKYLLLIQKYHSYFLTRSYNLCFVCYFMLEMFKRRLHSKYADIVVSGFFFFHFFHSLNIKCINICKLTVSLLLALFFLFPRQVWKWSVIAHPHPR